MGSLKQLWLAHVKLLKPSWIWALSCCCDNICKWSTLTQGDMRCPPHAPGWPLSKVRPASRVKPPARSCKGPLYRRHPRRQSQLQQAKVPTARLHQAWHSPSWVPPGQGLVRTGKKTTEQSSVLRTGLWVTGFRELCRMWLMSVCSQLIKSEIFDPQAALTLTAESHCFEYNRILILKWQLKQLRRTDPVYLFIF